MFRISDLENVKLQSNMAKWLAMLWIVLLHKKAIRKKQYPASKIILDCILTHKMSCVSLNCLPWFWHTEIVHSFVDYQPRNFIFCLDTIFTWFYYSFSNILVWESTYNSVHLLFMRFSISRIIFLNKEVEFFAKIFTHGIILSAIIRMFIISTLKGCYY